MAEKRGRKASRVSRSSRSSSPRSSARRASSGRSLRSSRTSRSSGNSRRSYEGFKPVKEKEKLSRGRNAVNMRIVLNNLILFVVLFIISIILYQILSFGIVSDPSGVFISLFSIFTIAFGFISIAFFITWLVLLFIGLLNKK